MTHTPKWRLFTGVARIEDPIAFCTCGCRGRMSFHEAEMRINSLEGVTLGEGASVKRLVEAIRYEHTLEGSTTCLKQRSGVPCVLCAALAPFEEIANGNT